LDAFCGGLIFAFACGVVGLSESLAILGIIVKYLNTKF